MNAQYPEDEFDQVPDEAPVGVHRKKPSTWRSVLPFLLVVILVPLIAWGANLLLNGSNGEEPAADSSSSAQQSEASEEPSESASASTTASAEPAPSETSATPTPSETVAEQTVDYAAVIQVLNGTDITGLAAERAAVLTGAGFANVSADNGQDWQTQQSTVFYRSAELEATASEVAGLLGISSVSLNSTDLGTTDIIVLVRD